MINVILNLIWTAIQLGMVFSLISFAIFLTLRVIDFPDLTINSTFTLGGAIASSMLKSGFDPTSSTLLAALLGAFAGILTSTLYLYVRIQKLLSGIIVMIALYSINLRIMSGPNLSLFQIDTIFTKLGQPVTLFIIILITSGFLCLFLLSEIGLGIRAAGQNYLTGEIYGVSRTSAIITILSLENFLTSLSGALFAQMQGFADINMGNGIMIIGLASLILGEQLAHTKKISLLMIICIIGTILYQFLLGLALQGTDIGLRSSDMQLVTAIIIVTVMVIKKKKQ